MNPNTPRLFKGTFLAQLEELMLSEQFNSSGFTSTKEGEVEVGTMTPMEKALWTMVECMTAEIMKEMEAPDTCKTNVECKLHLDKLELEFQQTELMLEMMWLSIRSRLALYSKIDIRADWKIVKCPPMIRKTNRSGNSIIGMFLKSLGGLSEN